MEVVLEEICKKADGKSSQLILLDSLEFPKKQLSLLFLWGYGVMTGCLPGILKSFLIHWADEGAFLGIGQVMEAASFLLVTCSTWPHLKLGSHYISPVILCIRMQEDAFICHCWLIWNLIGVRQWQYSRTLNVLGRLFLGAGLFKTPSSFTICQSCLSWEPMAYVLNKCAGVITNGWWE